MRHIIIITLSMLLALPSAAATKAEADALYGKEEYQKAAKAYTSILATDGVASEVYYNLGNCYYKLDNIPQAILNYERALMLDPGDADIRANLAFARGKTLDKVTPPSEMFFVTWWRNFTHIQSLTAWARWAIACFVLALISLAFYFLAYNMTVRKTGFYLGAALMLLVVMANLAAYTQYVETVKLTSAVVMSPSVSVKSSPSAHSTDLFLIHEGTKVEILDHTMKDWYEIKFEEGKQGWLPAETVEII